MRERINLEIRMLTVLAKQTLSAVWHS